MSRKALAAALLLAALCRAAAAQEEDFETASPGLLSQGGLVIFYDEQAPLSFVASSPRDIPVTAARIGEVKGRGCQRGFSVPLSLSFRPTTLSAGVGNGGYQKALSEIKAAHPGLTGIYDVKVDVHTLSILGLYRRVCTEVSARGFQGN